MSVGEAEVSDQVSQAEAVLAVARFPETPMIQVAQVEALVAIALAIQNLATVIAHKGDIPTVYGGPR